MGHPDENHFQTFTKLLQYSYYISAYNRHQMVQPQLFFIGSAGCNMHKL